MKLFELKTKRQDIISKMDDLTKGKWTSRTKTDFEEYELTVSGLDSAIEKAERQESKIIKDIGKVIISDESFREFADWADDAVEGRTTEPYKLQLRADPILTTTDAATLNKTVASVSNLFSPAEEMLKGLGVKFYTNQTGQVILPRLVQSTAGWVNEAGDASTADLGTQSIILQANRVQAFQSVTRETLAQTNPDVLSSIVGNLYRSLWQAVATKFFDEVEVDAASQVSTATGPATLRTFTNMEASLGNLDLMTPSYVMNPTTKSYCKSTAGLTNQAAIWTGNTVNDLPAASTPHCNDDKVYFGDWSKAVVATWGSGVEIIVDPFTQAKQGTIVYTAMMLADVGVHDPQAFVILADASTY